MKKNEIWTKKNEKYNVKYYLNVVCIYLHYSFFLFLHDKFKKRMKSYPVLQKKKSRARETFFKSSKKKIKK